jgi:hypothetical protein
LIQVQIPEEYNRGLTALFMSPPGFEPGTSAFLRIFYFLGKNISDEINSYKSGALDQAELWAHNKTDIIRYLKVFL